MKKIVSMLLVVAMLAVCLVGCGSSTTPSTTDADNTAVAADTQAASDAASDAGVDVANGEGKSIGFVTFGMGGDFFQQLADAYKAVFEANGWKADYADGEFNPETQIAAAENYIAMGVDVLVIWAVDAGSVASVIDTAMAQGIKVVAFVMPTEKYNALMVSDEARLADSAAALAAAWIDEAYADAEDGSVPIAVFECGASENGLVQSAELKKIAEFSKKAGEVTVVDCADETAETGQANAELLYTTNPEIQVFLSAHNGLANGINAFYTSAASPVTDYSKMGIFSINADDTAVENILKSASNGSPLRGSVLTGGAEDTANELFDEVTKLMSGEYEDGHIRQANTLYVNASSAQEYLDTHNVTTLSDADFGMN